MSGVAIIGSGFGLYGYLPALASGGGARIILPLEYREKFARRPEIAWTGERVEWVADKHAALARVGCVVMVLPPEQQSEYISLCLAAPHIGELLLEKPLARSPEEARRLFAALIESRKTFRIGYLFRFTSWGEKFAAAIHDAKNSTGVEFAIRLSFMAHHFKHDIRNWKRFHSTGGGAERFFGIHFIALLAELGYDTVIRSEMSGPDKEEIRKWSASFGGGGLPPCHVEVDTYAPEPRFHIARIAGGTATLLADQDGLFDGEGGAQRAGLDDRVPLLIRHAQSLAAPSQDFYPWYEKTLTLWAEAEAKASFVAIAGGA